jgi:hypothetical protein
MKKFLKNLLFGFMAWLIPFVAAFFFYSREGKLAIDQLLFKNIMVVVGSITGAILLILYFKKINQDYLKEGVMVGIIWLAVNLILDLLVLIPMSGMTVSSYFPRIGLGYLAIPAMAIAVGAALGNKK